jgi:hypothetical protein
MPIEFSRDDLLDLGTLQQQATLAQQHLQGLVQQMNLIVEKYTKGQQGNLILDGKGRWVGVELSLAAVEVDQNKPPANVENASNGNGVASATTIKDHAGAKRSQRNQ